MLDTVFIPFPSTSTGQRLCVCMSVSVCLPTDLAVDLSRRVLGLKQKRASLSRCYVLCCPHVMCSTLKTVYKLSDRVLTAVLALSIGRLMSPTSIAAPYIHPCPRCPRCRCSDDRSLCRRTSHGRQTNGSVVVLASGDDTLCLSVYWLLRPLPLLYSFLAKRAAQWAYKANTERMSA